MPFDFLHRSAMDETQGLSVIRPEGAMYMMVQIHTGAFRDIASDSDFARLLLEVCAPGKEIRI